MYRIPVVLLLGCVILIIGCSENDVATGAEFSGKKTDSAVIFTPGETWSGPSIFYADENHRSGAAYAMATANISIPGKGSCSAFLVGPSRMVTADHCLPSHAPLGLEISAEFGRVRNNSYLHLFTTLELFRDLGYRGSALLLAAADFARSGSEQYWTCELIDRDGGRDIAYFECAPKMINDPSGVGYSVLYPGDLFGHLDPVATNPRNDRSVYYLTVNSKGNSTAARRVLLSPNGRVQNRGATPCASGYSSHCTGTQGADLLPGSSGGAALLRSSNRVFGVSSFHRWSGGGGANSRTPRCHTGFLCWPNKNMFARFTTKVYEDQFFEPISALTETNAYVVTQMIGSGGTSHQQLICSENEAVVGLIGSAYIENNTNEARLGNLGVVCGPLVRIPGALTIWQSDNFFVQTAGSLDTDYYATGSSTQNGRARWNRYRRTIFSNSGNTSTFTKEQETLLCPPSMAMTGVEVSLLNQRILAVSSIVCNYPNGDSTTETLMKPRSRSLGYEAQGAATRIECPASRISSGMNVWTHPYTSRLQLRCRVP